MATAAVNGAVLEYEQDGSGPPILLIHGTGGCMEIWGEVPALLARTHRVIWYDRRGFGRSAGVPASRLGQHLDDAAALLDYLEFPAATVVGWSGGGALALGFASTFPKRVSALVLVEPAVHLLTHPSGSTLRMLGRSQFARRVRRDDRAAALAIYRWAGRYTSGGNAFDNYPAEWRSRMLEHAPATMVEMDQLSRPYPSKKAIRSISAPATCVIGTLSDPVFPRVARFLVPLMPQARLVTIEGACHFIPTDQPQRLVAAVPDALAASPSETSPQGS